MRRKDSSSRKRYHASVTVRVSVMVGLMFVDSHHAAMRHFTLRVFKLNGRVMNTKALAKHKANLLENPGRF